MLLVSITIIVSVVWHSIYGAQVRGIWFWKAFRIFKILQYIKGNKNLSQHNELKAMSAANMFETSILKHFSYLITHFYVYYIVMHNSQNTLKIMSLSFYLT